MSAAGPAARAVAPDSAWLALLLFPLILAVATGAGRRILRWMRVAPAAPLEAFVFSAAVGLGTLAYVLLAVGLLGGYHRAAFLVVLGAFAALALPELRAAPRAVLRVPRSALRVGLTALGVPRAGRRVPRGTAFTQHPAPSTQHPAPGTRATGALVLGGGILFGVMTLLGALAPPGGNDWDGLAYHLAAPKVYLRHGQIHFIPYDSHTNFPFTLDMLFGLGLALAGAPLAKLFHWGTGILTALAVGVFCATHFCGRDGVKPLPPWAPPLAALLFLSVPQVAWEATSAYIDLSTALYQFLALYAVLNAVFRASGAASLPWWAVAGAMSGWSMGTKMTAMLPFGMLVAAAGAWSLTRAGRPARRGVALLLLLGVAVASPWYVKSAIWTNNPVYPFFYRLFPHSINWTAEAEDAYRQEQAFFGLGRDPAALIKAPWNVTMEGAAFFTVFSKKAREAALQRPGGIVSLQRQGGNVWGSVGAALLGFLPLWFFVTRGDRRVAWLIAYIGANLLGWFFLTQQTRYLLPVLAAVGAASALLIAWLPHGFLRVAAALFAAVTVGVNAQATYRFTIRPVLPVVLGQESREAYLTRTLPDIYPALRFVNTLPPESRVAFLQEVRGYYADRDYFWANPLQHTLIPYESLPDGRAWAQFLRDELEITHVLVNEIFARGSEETIWYRLYREAVAMGALEPLYQQRGVGVYRIR